MKARKNNTGARTKITTYTSTDAKLKRLLYLYSQHHWSTISLANARVSACDMAKLRNSEKQQWINTLTAAEITWRKTKRLERDKQQQQITKYFNIKPKHNPAKLNQDRFVPC